MCYNFIWVSFVWGFHGSTSFDRTGLSFIAFESVPCNTVRRRTILICGGLLVVWKSSDKLQLGHFTFSFTNLYTYIYNYIYIYIYKLLFYYNYNCFMCILSGLFMFWLFCVCVVCVCVFWSLSRLFILVLFIWLY